MNENNLQELNNDDQRINKAKRKDRGALNEQALKRVKYEMATSKLS